MSIDKKIIKIWLIKLCYLAIGLIVAYFAMRLPIVLGLNDINHLLCGILAGMILIFTFIKIGNYGK